MPGLTLGGVQQNVWTVICAELAFFVCITIAIVCIQNISGDFRQDIYHI